MSIYYKMYATAVCLGTKKRFNCICTNAFVNAGNIVDYELVIPDGVNVINDHAFTGARFKRLEIPDTVTFIGEYVFF